MTASTRRRIASDITDLQHGNHGITKGFTDYDVETTIRRMETRSDQNLDQMVNSGSKEYSTLLLAACRYTAAVKGQQAAQVEMEAASDNLITLGAG